MRRQKSAFGRPSAVSAICASVPSTSWLMVCTKAAGREAAEAGRLGAQRIPVRRCALEHDLGMPQRVNEYWKKDCIAALTVMPAAAIATPVVVEKVGAKALATSLRVRSRTSAPKVWTTSDQGTRTSPIASNSGGTMTRRRDPPPQRRQRRSGIARRACRHAA